MGDVGHAREPLSRTDCLSMCEKDENDDKRLTTNERTTMVTEDELVHQMAAVTIADALRHVVVSWSSCFTLP